MKKINRSILHKVNYCIGFILSLFGITFQSCAPMYGPPINPEDIPVAYGTPSAEFHISGRVENKLGKSIEGIKISLYSEENPVDTTNADGSFNIDVYDYWPDKKITLIASDIDSTENGSYKTDTIYLSPKYEDDPNNGWNQIANIDNVVITLEEEKDNNE